MEEGNDFQKFAQSLSHIGDSFKRINEARQKIETLFTPFQSALPALESLKSNLSRVDEVQRFFQEAPKRLKDQAFSPLCGIVAAPGPPMVTESMMDEARKGLQEMLTEAFKAALEDRTVQPPEKHTELQRDSSSVKNDPEWISQAEAAAKYNLPKSTLSKYAHQSPGDLNFLESRTEGSGRYYKVSDLRILARSRRAQPSPKRERPESDST